MIDHLSNCGIIQHHIGNCNLNIDHQTVYLMPFPKTHGTDQDIITVFTSFPDTGFIFTEQRRNLLFFHRLTFLFSQYCQLWHFLQKKREVPH